MSRARLVIKITPAGDISALGVGVKRPNIAEIVGTGIKVCEEIMDGEMQMIERDLKR